ncbi:MAG: hypothetical protein M3463_12655, partial [Verrucomicrobiota bacterium]|nr:hypothetical protein [Verrucomicrobiota bacterium]
AHADARRIFHDSLGITLDPRGGRPPVEYPGSLPLKARKGYFGEVFSGILAEAGQVHAEDEWRVPIFLFRLHTQAEEYLMRLITGEPAAGTIVGRTGSDNLALSLNGDGTVKAILGAEAKCYSDFNITKACEALADLGAQAGVPVSLGQLKRLLAEIDPERFEATILDLEKIIKYARQATVPRHDLLVLIFEDPKIKTYNAPRISVAEVETNYAAKRPLQVVEVHLPGAGALIEELYADLYAHPPNPPDAAA